MTITGRLINNKRIVCWGPVWSCIRNIKYILVAGHLNVTVMLCGWVHLVVLYKASLMCIVMSDRVVPYTQVQHTCRDLASHREVERRDKGLPRIPHGPGNEARLNPFFSCHLEPQRPSVDGVRQTRLIALRHGYFTLFLPTQVVQFA